MDAQGNIIKRFDSARLSAEISAAVRQGGPWGVVDAQGNLIKRFDPAMLSSEAFVATLQDQQWGLANAGGYVIKQFSSATPSSELLVAVAQDGKRGIIDLKGNYVFKLQSEPIWPLAEGWIAVQADRTLRVRAFWGIIEKDLGGETMWGFMDMQGNYVVEPQFYKIMACSGGLVAVRRHLVLSRLNPTWFGAEVGIVDEEGNYITKFDVVEPPAEERDPNWIDGALQWGFMDTKGNYIFEPQFDEVWQLAAGLIAVAQDGKWGLVDTKGNHVVEPQFDRIGEFDQAGEFHSASPNYRERSSSHSTSKCR